MFEKLKGVEKRFSEIEELLSDPDIINNREAYQKYVREHAELSKVVTVFRTYNQVLDDLDESAELLVDGDSDIKDLAREEIDSLTQKKESLEEDLKKLLVPKDPNDERNVIIEIRA